MEYVSFDVETTGTDPGSRMVELAAIIFDENCITGRFETLVNPGMPLPEDVVKIHGITDDMIADKPDAGIVLHDFFEWLSPHDNLIAHNAKFDTGIMSWEARRYGIDIPDKLMVTDTLEIAKYIGKTKNNKLITLAEHYGLKAVGKNHRALSDAHMCMQYFQITYHPLNFSLPFVKVGHDYNYTDQLPEKLSALPDLVEKGNPLTFLYKDTKNQVTERTITPYGWALTPSGLMFHGGCHLRKARRTFLADSIIEVIQEVKTVPVQENA